MADDEKVGVVELPNKADGDLSKMVSYRCWLLSQRRSLLQSRTPYCSNIWKMPTANSARE